MEDSAVGRRLSEPATAANGPPPPPIGPRPSKVKALMANWEGKKDGQVKPPRKGGRESSPDPNANSFGNPALRKDSDSSSRGRMGSPSGKSHDSSDGEQQHLVAQGNNNNWASRTSSSGSSSGMGKSPSSGRRGRGPGAETRLDRLVRRPSMEGGKPVPPPTSGIPVLKGNHPRAKPRQVPPPPTPPNNNEVIETCFQVDEDEQEEEEEPLYDTVANDIAEDEYYDNHLLYGGQGAPRTTTTAGVADRYISNHFFPRFCGNWH